MINGLIGKKLGMSQVFGEGGKAIPVTVVEAGPCVVVQRKTASRDGYEAVQVGFQEERKKRRVTKSVRGHFQKAGAIPSRHLREFALAGGDLQPGQGVTVEIFQPGERVDVTGISKGKGFQGVMKRLKYKGGPGSHGSMFNRAPGSIGASAYPSRVWKGKGLPGQMGSERVTVKGLEVVEVRKEQHLLLLKGAAPGAPGGLLLIRKVRKGK
jgi:large subunit ribosomal protein L3